MNPPLKDIELHPHLFKIVNKYCQLITKLNLSEKDNRKLREIIALSLYDEGLSYWLRRADILAGYQLNTGNLINYDALRSSLLLEQSVRRLKQTSVSELNIKQFLSLVRSIKLNRCFIDGYTCFNSEEFARKFIFHTSLFSVYVIGWKPGQVTDLHHHGSQLDAILVHKGQLTHWLCKPNEKRVFGSHYLGPGEQLNTGSLMGIDRNQFHQMGNTSEEDLVTVHFRFGYSQDSQKIEDGKTEYMQERPIAIWSIDKISKDQLNLMPSARQHKSWKKSRSTGRSNSCF